MMLARCLVLSALGLLALDSTLGAAHAAPSIERCLERAERSLVGEAVRATLRSVPGGRHDDLAADARGVVWRPRAGGARRFAAALDGRHDCWIGGEIIGRGQPGRGSPSGLALGMAHPTNDTEIHSLTVKKTLDGIWVGSETVDLRLTNIWVSETADACLTVNHRGDLVVDGAFLRRCARVIDLRSRQAGSSLTIENSLIRIDDAPGVRGRGRLLNQAAARAATRVAFHDNIVATAAVLDAGSLAVIEADCAGNVLVWLGRGDYPGDLPDCFEISRDPATWRAARRAWTERHEQQLAALPRPSACTTPEVPVSIAPRKTVGRGTPASCTGRALRRALEGGGRITFACGAAPVRIPIDRELVVASRTILDGGGKVTLDGRNRTRIIRNDSELTLRAITLTRGRQDVVWNGSPNGGGAVNTTYGHRLYVVDSVFTDNWTSAQGFGGALFQAGAGSLTVVRSRFENNQGGGGGAIYNLLAGLQVVDSDFLGNRGSSGWLGGGGIMTDGASANSHNGGSGGEITICGSRFDANQALATGGGAYLYAYLRDTVSVSHSTFTANRVIANDGGVSMGGGLRLGAAPALVAESTFRNNTASMGGGIATTGEARTVVRDSTFACNSSDIEGGNVRTSGNRRLGC